MRISGSPARISGVAAENISALFPVCYQCFTARSLSKYGIWWPPAPPPYLSKMWKYRKILKRLGGPKNVNLGWSATTLFKVGLRNFFRGLKRVVGRGTPGGPLIFFRIFLNFHIFDIQGGGVTRSHTRKLPFSVLFPEWFRNKAEKKTPETDRKKRKHFPEKVRNLFYVLRSGFWQQKANKRLCCISGRYSPNAYRICSFF